MENLKLRVKRRDNQQWLYDNVSVDTDSLRHNTDGSLRQSYINQWLDTIEKSIPVYRDSYGEFTGIYDDEGREVYEGDIAERNGQTVTFHYHPPWNFFIVRGETSEDLLDDTQSLLIKGSIHDGQK